MPRRCTALSCPQAGRTTALRLINIEFGGHHVEIAGKHDGHTGREKLRGAVRGQSIEPAQLVIEPRAGGRIAVGQIQAPDQYSVDRRLDVAAVRIIWIPRQAAPRFCWRFVARKYSDVARKRAVLAALVERIEVRRDQIDIRLRPPRLGVLFDVPVTPLQSMTADEIQTLSVPVRLRRAGREIRMVIDSTDPFAAAKPDARLIKLLLRARRFNATLAEGEGVPFASLAEREGVSRSYFTRLVRLSYLAPDLTQAIIEGRQPRDLTPEKLLEHSRLPLAWHEQQIVLGFG
jgi:hypothetical protein